MALFVGVLGGLAAIGVLVAVTGWTPGRERNVDDDGRFGELLIPVCSAAMAGAVALVVTGWVVAALAGAVGGLLATRAWRNRGESMKAEQARITALASWCEQLRDLLSAEHGMIGTIAATAKTCPDAIRQEVTRLATRLSRQQPATTIRQFAAEIDDPSGDLIASVLLLAMSRSSRTSELLSELALTIRDRAAMRLRVEADRSGQRSEARFIVGFSAVVIGGVIVFGRNSEFLNAYDDSTGQLVLLVVVGFFALGGWWMARLSRFERPARFLSVGDHQEED